MFRYLQIKNFLSTNAPSDLTSPNLTVFEKACNNDPHRRGLISDIYTQLLSHNSSSPLTYTTKWETDLQLQPEKINWSQIWNNTKSASPNIVAFETNYKVLTRWYLVPARISQVFSTIPVLILQRMFSTRITHTHMVGM